MTTHDDGSGRTNLFDASGYSSALSSDETTRFSGIEEEDSTEDRRPATRWHGGLDFGLLILRIVLGGTMGAHGLQKVFGLFNGPGVDGFARALGSFGYTSQTTLLSWVTGLTELGAGALLVLGLFTPLAAAGILGVTANIVYAKFSGGFFLGQGNGYEYELLLGVGAFSLLFTGPGRISLDVNTPWRRRPVPFGLVGLVLAAGAAVAVILLFR